MATPTDDLRAASEPAWTDATEHRFVEELAAGSLDDAVFRRYLVEDYRFVETLAGVFGRALAQAPGMDAKAELAGFLGTLTTDEDDYFARAFDALDVDPAGRSEPLAPVTARFEDLLLRAAGEGGYAETLAVLVPAEWVYLEWATRAADADPGPDRFYLSEWVDLHADPAFEAFVGWLRGELDGEYGELSARRRARVEDLFCRTVEYEAAFFDAAYESGE